ncbi:hypothetical protein A3D00_00970 [Candidatus Woesebacteria bacterium RIFCSPHIGHO2_02_FULL_38_9]|uniref:Regulatory protein RecX n=1 Tax=Candidatus Woesebacteria bacterium RIFCSPHIGHO2_01_FULL_39_28 TaxID=1802496 RepID=A0A1F7YH50_9BACT|nr:MAG: hypothetical protein A2627_01425 [Candidatus Woesebacteria bacterium RIFCSPHIGHO2_01_FULL_39_28]OGM31696.1 MAG: hypothetical protein A3D00_00970 [Candidatus Woesebacteria bacterium RIFCSPHIGHO2_02_FULL_38_9]OGM57635.1 MAG: hypothetical protein A3A50_01345 [Candidatus Woesebacteria bacterium RIFCSPLOWO2_01_FULL_38_20]
MNIYDRLLKFATLRPRSEKEILNWFKRKKIDSDLQKDLFNRLKHLNLVNDLEFTRWWIEQRNTFRPMGVRRLKVELALKGVDRTIIEKVLDEQIKPDEQKNYAKRLLSQKIDHHEKLDSLKVSKKAFEFLARRGFDFGLIKEVIDEFNLKE